MVDSSFWHQKQGMDVWMNFLKTHRAESVFPKKTVALTFSPKLGLLAHYTILSFWRLLDRVSWRWNRVFCWWLGICRWLGIYWWSSKQQGQSYKGSDWLLKGSQVKSSSLDTVGYFHLTTGSFLFPLCGLHRSLLTGACFEVNNLKSRVIILKVVFKDKNTHANRPLSLSLIHIWRCRRIERCRSRWSPYH